MRPHQQVLTGVGILAVALLAFETTSLDLQVQDLLYNPEQRTWLVDRNAALPRFFFYDGPKVVLAGWLFCLALSLWRPGLFPTFCPSDRRRTLYVLVCMGVIPATVAALKDATNVFYPYKVERYGGKLPYRKLIYSLYQRPGEPHSRGFPAGHASGGFAMLCLAYVAHTRRGRRQAVLAGMLAGWIPGVYQMAKGAHYLSHTVVTMLLAWIIAAAFARWFGLPSTAMPQTLDNRDRRDYCPGVPVPE